LTSPDAEVEGADEFKLLTPDLKQRTFDFGLLHTKENIK